MAGSGVRIKDCVIINFISCDKYKINWNTNFPGGDKKNYDKQSEKIRFKRKSQLKKNIHNTINGFKQKIWLQRYNNLMKNKIDKNFLINFENDISLFEQKNKWPIHLSEIMKFSHKNF